MSSAHRIASRVTSEARQPVDYAALLGEVLDHYRRDPACSDWTFTLQADAAAARGEEG